MLTWEDDVEVHALRKHGWTISAIARHTGFDRKTVCKYLVGDGKPACVPVRTRIRLIRSSTTSRPGWPRIRICGPTRCSASSKSWGSVCRIRA
ncbi:transposase [Mycobacterium lentiflavum]|uniref:Transposase n=1 Tax=Mycobacterium lentiflavum TaxID=141349 RepID=A0A0E4H1Z1_MYCLN|nr:transposase [Mycobacterium lentiflavum]